MTVGGIGQRLVNGPSLRSLVDALRVGLYDVFVLPLLSFGDGACKCSDQTLDIMN